MKLLVLEPAEAELTEAVRFYNAQSPKLGYEFALEVKAAFSRIKSHPLAWTEFSACSRRCLIQRFPHGVLYKIANDTIIIGAIMHLKQHPDVWIDRASDF